jgi:hypothetical protein
VTLLTSPQLCICALKGTGSRRRSMCMPHPLCNQILRAWKHENLCLGDVKLENFVVRDKRREPKADDFSPLALEVLVIDLAGIDKV